MKTKLALLSATGLTLLLSGVAYADSNLSGLKVTGDNNSALIVQSGYGNNAGSATYGLDSPYALKQTGDYNTLNINQAGSQNSVGTQTHPFGNTTYALPDSWAVIQHGSNNAATVNQNSANIYNGNILGIYIQNNNNNKFNLTQNALSYVNAVQNLVGEIYQGGAFGSGGGNNTLTITQTGIAGDNFGKGNTAKVVKQTDSYQTATITQSGQYDGIVNLTQTGGSYNTALVQESGTGNRVTSLTQTGAGNNATLILSGNYNGADSTSNPGSNAVAGDGYGKMYAAKTMTGAAGTVVNAVASVVTQTGNTNVLSFTAAGDNNAYGFTQIGDHNSITGSSYNDGNQAAVAMLGSYNNINFLQSGGANNLGVSIFGSYNNAGSPFSGDANFGMAPGYIQQVGGSNNSVTLNVGLSTGDSNGNLFAVTQNGSSNVVVGSISGGNNNQAAVYQNGSSNNFTFAQVGSNNNVGALQ
jgi:hypothetical protein